MTMCNVVPESALAQLPPDAPPVEAGPYDVMVDCAAVSVEKKAVGGGNNDQSS